MCCHCCCCCCGPASGQQPLESLSPVQPAKYRWFEPCKKPHCVRHNHDEDIADGAGGSWACSCRKYRHVVEALSCLFNCTVPYMISTLFKLAYDKSQRTSKTQPQTCFNRDSQWNVMRNVTAPYTELHDLEIYDSLYDRCGLPIDPLRQDNIYRVLRLLFYNNILISDHRRQLKKMLKSLNERNKCPVNVSLLLSTLDLVDLNQMMCSFHRHDPHIRRLFTAKKCRNLCSLYYNVVTIDKNVVKQQRFKHGYGPAQRSQWDKKQVKGSVSPQHRTSDGITSARQSLLKKQFCERRHVTAPGSFSFEGHAKKLST